MLRRAVLLPTVRSVLAVYFASSVRGGSVTYKIVNYPEQQDDWTLSRFITIKTDAATGELTEDDVQSWTVTVTHGDIKISYGRDQPGVGVDITRTVNYRATGQRLRPTIGRSCAGG